jgi:hypothetical protein
MKPSSNDWSAEFDGARLQIRGSATFPNAFSTASLKREQYSIADGDTLTFTVEFHRDKEPFCASDLIGPVHHLERLIPEKVSRVRVISSLGEQFEFQIVGRTPPKNSN